MSIGIPMGDDLGPDVPEMSALVGDNQRKQRNAIEQLLAVKFPSDSVMGRDLRAVCISNWKNTWYCQRALTTVPHAFSRSTPRCCSTDATVP